MRFQLLGPSGLRVSQVALGTMTFGDDFGWGASRDESRAMFDAYADAGGLFIDTANAYTGGTSERLVGEFVGAERDRFVIASKYTANMRPGDPNAGGNGRKNLVQSVEASLKRLGTDYLDVLWMHAWDGITPVSEVVRALDDLVRAGKVLYLGVSDTPAWVASEAITLARERGYAPFSAIQIEYSLAERTPERDLLPMAAAHGLSVL
ncbi:MAG TPA: aldo/keto reductase, partial [Rubricoccaceae bacterium]